VKTWSPSIRRRFRALADAVMDLHLLRPDDSAVAVLSAAAGQLHDATAEKRRPVPQHRKERAERKAAKREHTAKVRAEVFRRHEGLCLVCSEAATEMHHLVGGGLRRSYEAIGTCVPLCGSCHRKYHRNDLATLRSLYVSAINLRLDATAIRAVAFRIDKLAQHPSGAKPLEIAK